LTKTMAYDKDQDKQGVKDLHSLAIYIRNRTANMDLGMQNFCRGNYKTV
jgi:hypothetical protein